MDKFQQSLNQSIRHLQVADHMTYVTYPLINEKRLLLKIIEEINASITNCINAILEFEFKNKKPTQSSVFKKTEPTATFFKKYFKDYSLTENHIKKIQEIIEISNRHKESAMEFVRNEKIVILSNSLGTKILDIQQVKGYLLIAKELLLKVNQRMDKITN
ncbi:hypothetical protein J4429_04705 [Candidatus Pacearchaeota archaeon]|nr:hypothetical protein [Candidatus Pacearchaeota archaeon]